MPGFRPSVRRSALICLLSACQPATRQNSATDTTSDPRVVQVGDKFYPHDDVPLHAQNREEPRVAGVMQPDESNGKCRLFAPTEAVAQCCSQSYGLEISATAKACGYATYLGESYYGSCTYYFARDATARELDYGNLRIAWAVGPDPRRAAEDYAEMSKYKLKRMDFVPQALPEIPGAYLLTLDHNRWAFLPGWKKVRVVSWHQDFCPLEAMKTVLRQVASASEPSETPETRAHLTTSPR